MKKKVNILTVVFVLAISSSAFGQSKTGEGYYDSGDGKGNAPGSSSVRERNDAAQEREKAEKDARRLIAKEQNRFLPERQANYLIEDPNLEVAKDRAIKLARDSGAKVLAVLAVTRVVDQNAGTAFKIVLGVAFPATTIDRGSEIRRETPAPPAAPEQKRQPIREPGDLGNAKN